MDDQKVGSDFRRFLLLIWLLLLCTFLILGVVYRFSPRYKHSIQTFFPLFGGVSSTLDKAAEQLKNGKSVIATAGELFCGDLFYAETDSY